MAVEEQQGRAVVGGRGGRRGSGCTGHACQSRDRGRQRRPHRPTGASPACVNTRCPKKRDRNVRVIQFSPWTCDPAARVRCHDTVVRRHRGSHRRPGRSAALDDSESTGRTCVAPTSGCRQRPTSTLHRSVRAALVTLASVLFVLVGAGLASAQDPPDPPSPPADTAPAAPDEESADGVIVRGTLNNAGERLDGVVVRATTESGEVVTETESADGGRWELTVPPGTYVFEVDTESLPDDVTVQTSVTRDVAPGRANTVIFSFGEARSGSTVAWGETLVRTIVDGLRFGLVIAIAGVGLSLIFGTTGLTNFAHGELVTLGS